MTAGITRAGKFDGVGKQIGENLFHEPGVAFNEGQGVTLHSIERSGFERFKSVLLINEGIQSGHFHVQSRCLPTRPRLSRSSISIAICLTEDRIVATYSRASGGKSAPTLSSRSLENLAVFAVRVPRCGGGDSELPSVWRRKNAEWRSVIEHGFSPGDGRDRGHDKMFARRGRSGRHASSRSRKGLQFGNRGFIVCTQGKRERLGN